MNKHILNLTFYSILLFSLLVSCTKEKSGYIPADDRDYVFITGECLASNHLRLLRIAVNPDLTTVHSYRFVFEYDLAGDVVYVNDRRSEEKDPVWTFPYRKFVPAEAVFNSFGENAPIVSKLYEDSWRGGWNNGMSSIFLDSGVSLTADKDFAGYEAGTNIAEDIISYYQWEHAGREATDKPIIFLRVPFQTQFAKMDPIGEPLNNYECLLDFVQLCIPVHDPQEVVEDITITLTIPVKVGLYLTWLNDKLSDPDAPFPYYDDTLTCTFTLPRISADLDQYEYQ